MIRKSKLKSLFIVGLISLAGLLTVTSLAATIFSVVSAALDIDPAPSFEARSGGNVYYCYKINDDGYSNKIAIAWGKDPAEAAPDSTLTIPSTLRSINPSDSTTYTVAAIANSGFQRCAFKNVSLPDTIEEIGKGAFAYCEKLSDIRIPPLVDVIRPSTFVSCRALKTITYSENTAEEGQTPVYEPSSVNTVITRIEDHAFDSCISLIQFECPKSLVYIGKSAFQNCKSITRFYLPTKNTSPDYGNITIDSYAFADCAKLSWVYFEENLTTVHSYAFVDCHTDLIFHYGYDISGGVQNNPEFDSYWRRKSLKSDNLTIYNYDDTTNALIRSADGYPGLKIAIDTKDVYLNSWEESSDSNTNTVKIINGSGGYAVVYQWDNPGMNVTKIGDDFDYFKYGDGGPGSGILTIPSTVTSNGVNYTLKIVGEEAFKEHKDLKEVHFLDGIVQIQKSAFYNCDNLDTIDFGGVTVSETPGVHAVTTLKEISRNAFTINNDSKTEMTGVTSLKLPASLEYIGPYAFENFTSLSSLSFTTAADDSNSRKPSLKVIGNHAFYKIGKNLTGNDYVHLTLPSSLDDSKVKNASMNAGGQNWAAIGPYAFGGGNNNANRIATVTMETSSNSLKTSLAPNAFNYSSNLVRFTANANLCMIGTNAFANCGQLKEVFLTTARAASYAGNSKYVWGTENAGTNASGSIFGGSACPDLVIYLDGNVPGKIGTIVDTSNYNNSVRWNSEGTNVQSFSNYLGYDTTSLGQGRKIIPTYTNIDFSNINKTSIIYYKPSDGTTLTSSPQTKADYFAGLIVFVKEGSSYTAAHYYTNNTNKTYEIDLRSVTHTYDGGSVNISNSLTKIGAEAFASDKTDNSTNADNQAPCPGRFFVLPRTVTTIEERAFFRRATRDPGNNIDVDANIENNGVAIVTTDNGSGTALGGLDTTYVDAKTDFSTNEYGYCNIPTVTRIENDAFYNNVFKKVEIASSLTFLGRSVFYTRFNSKLESVTLNGSDTNFKVINDGIYYNNAGDTDKKALLYQFQKAQTVVGGKNTLTIDDGTKAIGPSAITNTDYQVINLVTGLTQIHGSSFQGNTQLETLGIKADNSYSLEYIGANPYLVTAYKIERYKYFIGPNGNYIGYDSPQSPNMAPQHVDDLSAWGYITDLTSTGPTVTVSYKEEGTANKLTLYPFYTTTGKTVYGENKTIQSNRQDFMWDVVGTVPDTDVLSGTLPFDMIDYRTTINPNYASTQNRNSTFKDCTNLKMVDFRSMTSLKKIGYAAFYNCTNLMNCELGRTYNYYTYNASTKTITKTATKLAEF